ncbi:MAG: hypothetical protein HQM08_17625 [Candidatus Riflebacteria bacterium]|nr:hypothetical protein [Candidatus Riflebacteria bacterium]
MIKEKFEKIVKKITIRIVQTEIDTINRKDITSTGLRMYDGKSIGVAGTIGKYDEAQLEKKAVENLDLKLPYPCSPTGKFSEKKTFDTPPIQESSFVAEVEEILSALGKSYPEFIFSNQISLSDVSHALKNDQGLDLFNRNCYLETSVIFKEKASTSIFDGYFSFESRKYDRNELLKLAGKICTGYQSKVDLPKTSRIPVIFSTSNSLPFKKFQEDLNVWKIGTKTSLFTEKFGKKIFNENFSLVQSFHPDDTMGPFFDYEGIVNKDYRYPLIKNGIIEDAYTDKRSAQKFSLPQTGSGFGDFDELPSAQLENYIVPESDKTIKELLTGRMGIYAYLTSGGDFTPSGGFGTPVQLGYLFDGEKLVGRLPQFHISSNVYDMFGKDFIGVSKDLITPLENSRYLAMEMNIEKE